VSYAVSAVSEAPPVYRPRPSSSEDDSGNAAQIAALQKVLATLQNQRAQDASPDSASSPEEANQQSTQIADQISSVQARIAMLRQQEAMQAAKKSLEAQDSQDASTKPPPPTEPPHKTPEQVEKENEERQQLAIAKAAEQGLEIGTNVDTYA